MVSFLWSVWKVLVIVAGASDGAVPLACAASRWSTQAGTTEVRHRAGPRSPSPARAGPLAEKLVDRRAEGGSRLRRVVSAAKRHLRARSRGHQVREAQAGREVPMGYEPMGKSGLP